MNRSDSPLDVVVSIARWVTLSVVGAGACGFVLGAFYGRTLAPSPDQGSGSARMLTSLLGAARDGKESRDEEGRFASAEKRMARLCAQEALRIAGSVEGQDRRQAAAAVIDDTNREDEAARDELDEIFVLVQDKRLWSRGAGAKARALLSQLPEQDSRELREKLDVAALSGEIHLQAGAWLPQAER